MNTLKILIADNNLSVLSFILGLVRNSSYKLYTMKDALKCLDILKRKEINAAVVEMDLEKVERENSVEASGAGSDQFICIAHSETLELGEAAIAINKDVFLDKLKKYIPNGWRAYLESFLDDNYSNPDLKFKDLMRHFRFSRSYGYFLFKKHLNKTFSQALREVRCRNAMILLEEMPNASIANIADRCGFRTTSRLSEAFRRLYGVSPSIYRRKWTFE